MGKLTLEGQIALAYIGLAILTVSLWQYFGSTYDIVRLYISTPKLVSHFFLVEGKELTTAFFTTALEAIVGLLMATIAAILLVLIGLYRPILARFFMPLAVVSQIVPIIVLAPMFMIIFGNGLWSKIVLVAVISFFPILISLLRGIESVPIATQEFLAVYKVSLKFKIYHIYRHLLLPNFFSGLRTAGTLSVIGAIVAEFVGAKQGLGKNLFLASIRLEPDLMVSSLLLSSCLGLTLYGLVVLLEKKYGAWYLK